MSNASDQRAGASFPHQAHELREIASTVRNFGLPGPTTTRTVERIQRIAGEIEGAPEEFSHGVEGEGG